MVSGTQNAAPGQGAVPARRKSISAAEKICVFLLALCPLLQHYKGVVANAAVTVLILVTPYATLRLYKKGRIAFRQISLVLPLILYFFFKVADHGTSVMELGQAIVFSVLVLAVAANCFDTSYFMRVIIAVSVLASLLIILQYICYYLLHFHIQMVPTSLLLERSSQWIAGAKTGRASVTGKPTKFYRPSAFFLEPSHMFIYMFIPLILLLLSSSLGSRKRLLAVLLTIGMFLSTSGMGIVMSIGIWCIFLGRSTKRSTWFSFGRLFRKNSLLLLVVLSILLCFMFAFVPFFRNSIMRIFTSGKDYTNAISGRVTKGFEAIRSLHGKEILIGKGDVIGNDDAYMSSFNACVYRYGILGAAISYLFYLQGLFRIRKQYFWISAVIIVLSFFSSHTHSTMFMIYCTFVFVYGYNGKLQRRRAFREWLSRPLTDEIPSPGI